MTRKTDPLDALAFAVVLAASLTVLGALVWAAVQWPRHAAALIGVCVVAWAVERVTEYRP